MGFEHKQVGMREEGQVKIIRALLEKPLTFTELIKGTGFSKPTLSNHLKVLRVEKVIEKALDEMDRVVYRITIDHKRLYQEFKVVAFDTVLDVLERTYPKIRLLVEVFIWSILDTRLHAEFHKSTPSQLESIFLDSLDENMTPLYASIIGLPDGFKLSTWIKPIFEKQGGLLVD